MKATNISTTDALLLEAVFSTPPAGAAFTEISGLFAALDLSFGTAWLLGNASNLATLAKDDELTTAPKLDWDEEQRHAALVDRRIMRRCRDSIEIFPPAMPQLTTIRLESPLELVTLLPPAFVTGLGALYTVMHFLERVFTAPVRVDAEIEHYRAQKTEWEALRSKNELEILELAAKRIAQESPPDAKSLELRSAPEGREER